MKKLSQMNINSVVESTGNDVYVVYLADKTMYNYYKDKDEAQQIVDQLNKESKINGAFIKTEPITNYEKS